MLDAGMAHEESGRGPDGFHMADLLGNVHDDFGFALIDAALECAQWTIHGGFDGRNVAIVDCVIDTLMAGLIVASEFGMDMQ